MVDKENLPRILVAYNKEGVTRISSALNPLGRQLVCAVSGPVD